MTDDNDAACLYYKLTYEPKGSDELKIPVHFFAPKSVSLFFVLFPLQNTFSGPGLSRKVLQLFHSFSLLSNITETSPYKSNPRFAPNI